MFRSLDIRRPATFMEYGSEQGVKDAGLLQIEGKDYVIADGEIMHVRFNV